MGKYLQLLECPGCKKYMRPPIFLCENGHSYCKSCTFKGINCNTCKMAVKETLRNYLVESFCYEVTYPCIYTDKGCSFHQKLEKLIKHENEYCTVRPLRCPMNFINREVPCNWIGPYEELKDHIITSHNEMKVVESDTYDYTAAKEDPVFFMFCLGKLFQVCNDKGTYHVHMVGPDKDARTYSYAANIVDSRNKNFNITIGNLCNVHCKKDTDEMFKITIPHDDFNHFKIKISVGYSHFSYPIVK